MKGLICLYSGSGHTRLACEAIAARTTSTTFDLFDIRETPLPDLAAYDVVGFATWTDFGDPPRLMERFMRDLPWQDGKHAFVFNTFGAFSARTLATLDRWTRCKGFRVVCGHSLHTPENYPPLIRRGQSFADAPSKKELAAFDAFIRNLDNTMSSLAAGGTIPLRRVGLARVLPAFSRTHARRAMGEQFVDAGRCTECGICRDLCPYGAIRLDPKPIFDRSSCYGCWACYNHCPAQAIYTRKIKDVPQVAHPNDRFRSKLEGSPSRKE